MVGRWPLTLWVDDEMSPGAGKLGCAFEEGRVYVREADKVYAFHVDHLCQRPCGGLRDVYYLAVQGMVDAFLDGVRTNALLVVCDTGCPPRDGLSALIGEALFHAAHELSCTLSVSTCLVKPDGTGLASGCAKPRDILSGEGEEVESVDHLVHLVQGGGADTPSHHLSQYALISQGTRLATFSIVHLLPCPAVLLAVGAALRSVGPSGEGVANPTARASLIPSLLHHALAGRPPTVGVVVRAVPSVTTPPPLLSSLRFAVEICRVQLPQQMVEVDPALDTHDAIRFASQCLRSRSTPDPTAAPLPKHPAATATSLGKHQLTLLAGLMASTPPPTAPPSAKHTRRRSRSTATPQKRQPPDPPSEDEAWAHIMSNASADDEMSLSPMAALSTADKAPPQRPKPSSPTPQRRKPSSPTPHRTASPTANRGEIRRLQELNESLEGDAAMQSQRIEQLERAALKVKKENVQVAESFRRVQQENTQLSYHLKRLQCDHAKLQEEHEKVVAQLQEASQRAKAVDGRTARKNSQQLASLREAVRRRVRSPTRGTSRHVQKQLEEALGESRDLRVEVVQLKTLNAQLQKRIASQVTAAGVREQLEHHEETLNEIHSRVRGADAELSMVHRQNTVLEQHCRALEAELRMANKEKDQLAQALAVGGKSRRQLVPSDGLLSEASEMLWGNIAHLRRKVARLKGGPEHQNAAAVNSALTALESTLTTALTERHYGCTTLDDLLTAFAFEGERLASLTTLATSAQQLAENVAQMERAASAPLP